MSIPFDPILAAFHRLQRETCASSYELENIVALRHQYGADLIPRPRPTASTIFARRLAAHAAGSVGVGPELMADPSAACTRWKANQQSVPQSMMTVDDVITAETSSDNSAGGNQTRAELEGHDLWKKFDTHCTEMVITKSGRYTIGLHISEHYFIIYWNFTVRIITKCINVSKDLRIKMLQTNSCNKLWFWVNCIRKYCDQLRFFLYWSRRSQDQYVNIGDNIFL